MPRLIMFVLVILGAAAFGWWQPYRESDRCASFSGDVVAVCRAATAVYGERGAGCVEDAARQAVDIAVVRDLVAGCLRGG